MSWPPDIIAEWERQDQQRREVKALDGLAQLMQEASANNNEEEYKALSARYGYKLSKHYEKYRVYELPPG